MTAQVLNPASLPLKGIKLIEASAGTGKTWTIAALYTRLVLGHRDAESQFENPLTPDQILVVTFTDAATAELRDRIRKRLADAASHLANEDTASQDDFLNALTQGITPEVRQMLIHRLTIAADAMDDAAIYTIHGWCSRMLRQHAFDSGAPFELKIEGEEIELLNESVRDFWRTFFYSLTAEECRIIKDIAKSPADLMKKVRSLLQETDHALETLKIDTAPNPATFKAALAEVLTADQDCCAAEEAARIEWEADCDAIESVITKALGQKHLKGNHYQRLDERLKIFKAWANGKAPIENSNWIKLFSRGGFGLNGAAKGIEPEHPVFDLMAHWATRREAHDLASQAFHNLTLCSAARWIRNDFSRAKSLKARLDYNDLILKLHATLVQNQNQPLADMIRAQYPVALIDEFQDTDPQQYEIFETIHGQKDSDSVWLMVGDPKQAIYGFRGADVYAYLRARNQSDTPDKETPGIYTLPCNHRSTTALVHATNQIFQQAEDNLPMGAFNFPKTEANNDRIGFSSVNARGREEKLLIDGQTAPALTFWYDANGNEPLAQTHYRRQMAAHCANEIVTLLNKSGKEKPEACFEDASGKQTRLHESDIAILVRDGKEATAVRDALRARGLRSVYLSDRDSVYQSQEAKDLLVWLKACLNPQSSRLIRAAMATSTMGLAYDELEHLNGDEFALDQRMTEFTGYGDHWRSHGILPAIRQIILEQNLPERLMARPSGERTLTNLLHLAELLQTESEQHDGEHGALRFLQESITDENQDAKDNVLRLESDQNVIRVVTIHKSKGLEYPLVFLPFVCSYKETRTQNLTAYRYHLENDPIHPLKLELVKGCPDEKTAKKNMERERLQEELRLLYVAITRSRHACWLGMAPLKLGRVNATTLHKGAMGYLLGGDTTIPANELRSRIETCMTGGANPSFQIVDIVHSDPILLEPQSLETDTVKDEIQFRGKRFEPWWIASYSALKYSTTPMDGAIHSSDDDEPETAGEDQSSEENDINGSSHDGYQGGGLESAISIHAFPAGRRHGVFLHDLLESAAKVGFDVLSETSAQRDLLVDNATRGSTYGDWNNVLKTWLSGFINKSFTVNGQTLSLSRLPATDCLTEMEFWFEASGVKANDLDRIVHKATLPGKERPLLQPNHLSGMMKGFIDLVFRHDGKYYIADYKSNRLGWNADAYSEASIREALLHKRYDVQYVLYLLALHRYLKSRLGDHYDYDRDVGGALYFFLRGVEGPESGVHFEKPSKHAIQQLDRLFQGQTEQETSHAGE